MLSALKGRFLDDGVVIPAHPLAMTPAGELDRTRQASLTRHYLESGVGGVAVGVHTTQFEIRDRGWYRDVLAISAHEVQSSGSRVAETTILVAGVLGPTEPALQQAVVAAELGYDLALVALPGWGQQEESAILDAIEEIGEIIPVFGFNLQRAVGKRTFSFDFWSRYVSLPCVRAMKIAPFDRYQTAMMVRAVVESGRDDVALYTGNDDSIVLDLLTPFRFRDRTVHIVGGLLGQWAVGTRTAVLLHAQLRSIVKQGGPVPLDLLSMGAALTDLNGALFDAANDFAGSIAGIGEILLSDGRIQGNNCINPAERLSPGQADEISRVRAAYPWLLDASNGSP